MTARSQPLSTRQRHTASSSPAPPVLSTHHVDSSLSGSGSSAGALPPPALGSGSQRTSTPPLGGLGAGPGESDADARLRSRDPGAAAVFGKEAASTPAAFSFGSGPAGQGAAAGAGAGGMRQRGVGRAGVGLGGLRKREWAILGVITLVAAGVRLWRLGWPTSVVFDEVHFGGFASKYIKRRFFMDVHPPLAKLLITLAAFIGGFDGEFDFKDIGKDYLEPKVPYVIMRFFPAILGLALVPITFLTLVALRLSLATAILGSLLITFENSLIAQSRLILLDSFLVFFTALTMYFWTRFYNLDSEGLAFTKEWWRQLTLTGLSLGAVVSCKWVGLFTIATVGLGTLRQLWLLLGNLKVTPRMWIKHFFARALCLIVVPLTFYMFMFQIHFWVLSGSGDGDGFMSSEFQHTLRGHGMDDTYADVSFGSHVAIRHVNTNGGYLHSHGHAYPGGSQQQQITLYPHRDENNIWRITNHSAPDGPASYPWDDLPIEHILTGTKIRLEHITTEKRLHSHDVRPPVSDVDFQNEVSGYGFPGFAGDANDDFIVEIAHKTRGRRDRQARHRLKALRSEFRLRHALSGCYLFSHKVKLPEWGFEQQEVTCNKNPTWENSLWFIETNTHAQLPPDAEKVNYQRPSFLSKFTELQAVMWNTNQGLTERHAYDSRPGSWPWLRRGINFWVHEHRQVYLVGNPVIWWSSSLAIAAYVGFRLLLIVRAKRGFRDLQKPKIAFYDEVLFFCVLAWALHYLPFFLMNRQLFLHHYLPALYFAVLAFCSVFDYVTSALRPRTRVQVGAVILILVIWSYGHFSPLTYAGDWTKGRCENAKWLKTWDFSCNDFHENLAMYKGIQPPSQKVYPTAGLGSNEQQTTIVDEAPEPIRNAVLDAEKPEEKTVAPVGPANEVQMQQSTGIPKDGQAHAHVDALEGAEKAEDTRAPVGLDAGSPEVTAKGEDEGGWHGGAEDEAGHEGHDQHAHQAREVEQEQLA